MARPRKLSIEELFSIIEKYIVENQYITTLKYSELEKFSEKLGYIGATYQDFSRNKEVKKFVDEYNKQKKMTMYSKLNSDKLEKLNFSVDTVVDKNVKDVKQLKIILKVYKLAYDKAFDRLIENDKITKEYEKKIKEQEKIINDVKEKNKTLRKEILEKQQIYQSNRNKEKDRWIYLTIENFIKEGNVPIKSVEQVVDLLKNFGYSKKEERINDIDIIQSHLNEEITNNENSINEDIYVEDNNIISLSDSKNRLKVPDFMR